MRLKNIFALAIIVSVAASCSMGDELMENNSNNNQSTVFEKTAYVSFNVDAQKAITKAGETPADTSYLSEDVALAEVTSCSLIIMDKDGYVFSAYDNLPVNAAGQILFGSSTSLQLKVEKNIVEKPYDVLIVANAASTFKNAVQYSEITAKLLGESDKNKNIMVSPLTEIALTGYATIAEAQANKVNIEAHLSHLTAKIALCGFDVTFREGTLPTDVTIAKVELLNVNAASRLFNADPLLKNETWATTNIKAWDGATNAATTFTAPAFNSFTNQNANSPITMRLTLNYGTVTGKVFEFVINRPASTTPGAEFGNSTGHNYIQAGYIYQVYVNAKLTGDLLDCSVKCYTMDWKYEQRTVTLLDVTPR